MLQRLFFFSNQQSNHLEGLLAKFSPSLPLGIPPFNFAVCVNAVLADDV